MNYTKAYDYLIRKLQRGLDARITYHNADHTKKVIASAIIIARKEKVRKDDLTLLKTAALFHDSGFLISNTDHEIHSCELARKYLPAFQYSTAQTELICNMIMATKMPQSPYNQLSEILCDADLYYLGGNGYAHEAENLYQELLVNQHLRSEREWLKIQIDFLASHTYFTSVATENCHYGKSLNLGTLLSLYG